MAGPLSTWVLALAGTVTLLSGGVEGHGRLIEPPSRSTMWRYGFSTPPNYDDNQLFCGGVAVQYDRNGGKCGVCGDPWDGPRDNEPGGKFYTGIIVRKYSSGQVMEVQVQLTASHKGYFEFRLCDNNTPHKKITHDCLDRHVLAEAGSGTTRFSIQQAEYGNQDFTFRLQLPAGLKCAACVLQWKYNAGNSWGVDPDTGRGCIGCGNQEQFYGCSDIAIGHPEVEVGKAPRMPDWQPELEEKNKNQGSGNKWGVVGRRNNTVFGDGSSAMSSLRASWLPLQLLACTLALLLAREAV